MNASPVLLILQFWRTGIYLYHDNKLQLGRPWEQAETPASVPLPFFCAFEHFHLFCDNFTHAYNVFLGWFVCLIYLFIYFLVFRDRVSLYSPGCPGTHFVDQAGLELRNPPASASRVLGLKACAITPGAYNVLIIFIALFFSPATPAKHLHP